MNGSTLVKISSKSARELFQGCSEEYITHVCHGRCCGATNTGAENHQIPVFPEEEERLRAHGAHIENGFMTPKGGGDRFPVRYGRPEESEARTDKDDDIRLEDEEAPGRQGHAEQGEAQAGHGIPTLGGFPVGGQRRELLSRLLKSHRLPSSSSHHFLMRRVCCSTTVE